MKILILEDEAIIAESLYQLLNLLEYAPYEPVDTPESAITIIRTKPPDLLLLDLHLQHERSGLEVAEYVQTEQLHIPFIILTAHSDPATIAKVKQYHPAAFLIKPFMRDSLFAAIELAAPEEPGGTEAEPGEHELFLKTGPRYEKLDLRELIYVRANGKYSELHFTFGKRLIRMPLSAFINENHNISFLRVHKTYAVNPEFITAYTADELSLPNSKIPVGRFFMPGVNNYLRNRTLAHRK